MVKMKKWENFLDLLAELVPPRGGAENKGNVISMSGISAGQKSFSCWGSQSNL